jgi:hypothetical protein
VPPWLKIFPQIPHHSLGLKPLGLAARGSVLMADRFYSIFYYADFQKPVVYPVRHQGEYNGSRAKGYGKSA